MIEVELKARIQDKEAIKTRLDSSYRFIKQYHKKDRYFYFRKKGKKKKIRIREDGEDIVITFKDKTLREGIEVNREFELPVSNAVAAESMLGYLGCSYHYSKTKTGLLYKDADDRLSLELSDVGSLGCFLELEYLLESDDKQQIDAARRSLLEVLSSLGIPASAIEPRFYSRLILRRHNLLQRQDSQHSHIQREQRENT